MRINEITNDPMLNEYLDTSKTDPVLSDADVNRILAVKESDFSQPMSGDELMVHVNRLLGKQDTK